jgi:hypothetical protein
MSAEPAGEGHDVNQGEWVVAGGQPRATSSWEGRVGIDGVPRDFDVRQLRDWRRSVDTDAIEFTADGGLRPVVATDSYVGSRPIWRRSP